MRARHAEEATMQKVNRWCVVVLAAILAIGAGQAWAGDCPDEQATDVPGRVEASTRAERCGIGLKIFGIGGTIIGTRCPRHEIATPAHATCAGEKLAGHRCVKKGLVPVSRRECSCKGLVIPLIDTGIPTSCRCGAWKRFGTVENFETLECDESRGPVTGGDGGGPAPTPRRRSGWVPRLGL
ncbi:hypothetical protein [Planctomycetes bacterium Pla163]